MASFWQFFLWKVRTSGSKSDTQIYQYSIFLKSGTCFIRFIYLKKKNFIYFQQELQIIKSQIFFLYTLRYVQ